jgi:multiple sugar transport system permease protein
MRSEKIMNNNNRLIRKDWWEGYAFNAPAIAFAVAFILIPVIGTVIIGFFRDISFLPRKWIGLWNYINLLNDPHFWQSSVFTVLFVVASVSIEIILGLVFALVLNERLKFRGLLRAVILIPWAIPIAISARIWQLIYNYNYGVINYILTSLGISSEPVNWLGSSFGAFFALVLSDVWKTTPFVTIILLAGLATIPQDLYKQAKIDGTTFVQRFLRITLPLLRPILMVALLFRTIDSIRIFDLVYVLTGGGPGGSTTSLSLYAYNFFLAGDFGNGSAVSVILFIMAFALAVAYIKIGRFQESVK